MIWKLIFRSGKKDNFAERFSLFSKEKKKLLQNTENPVWIHAVSVGETQIALSLIEQWQKMNSKINFVLSTTTSTGQGLANSKKPNNLPLIYCPIDFPPFVKKTAEIINPSMLIIFETEIWPNIICELCGKNIPVALVNARMSDNSVRGYRRFAFFFRSILEKISIICTQSDDDFQRFLSIAPDANLSLSGNMKFDQKIPGNLAEIKLSSYFGKGNYKFLLGASTHPGEEKLIAETYLNLRKKYPNLKLILVPRHAERGREIEFTLRESGLKYFRKSCNNIPEENLNCLLADTTGELMSFIKLSDIIIMGKSLAGQDEGHNLIEPALFAKPVITGSILRNFRFILEALKKNEALITVDSNDELESAVSRLLENANFAEKLGKKARETILKHKGATEKTIKSLEDIIKQNQNQNNFKKGIRK